MRLLAPALVTSVLLAMTSQPPMVTSLITSYEELLKLAEGGNDVLVHGIEGNIRKEEERLEKLKSFLKQYFQTVKHDYQFQGDHPNDFYLMVKHYTRNFLESDIDDELIPVVEELIKAQNLSFPVGEDFRDAVLSLVRLQHVYRLRAEDMWEGNYLGYHGPRLDNEDTYLVGLQAYMSDYLNEARDWLILCVSLLTKEMDSYSSDGGSSEPSALPSSSSSSASSSSSSTDDQKRTLTKVKKEYYNTVALLGRTYILMNETALAREMHAKCQASGLEDIEDFEELTEELDSDNVTKLLETSSPQGKNVDDNITELCSRDKDHRVPTLRPFHVCRYKSDVFLPYVRYREEILSTSPHASLFYDVIYDTEIEKLKELSMGEGLSRGQVGGGNHRVSDVRTGDLSWVNDEGDPLVQRLSHRVKSFTRLDVNSSRHGFRYRSAEPWQVVNYGMGGHYDVHLDPFGNDDGGRLATVLFYLSDVEKGGATIFPRVGISVSPLKGMALMWYNYSPQLTKIDNGTLHAGCPVVIGNKWISNKWIWSYGNTFRRPCGSTPQSLQLDIEQIVSMNALKEIIL